MKGHKLRHDRSGVNDAYAQGSCSCGWRYNGWTVKRSDVSRAHASHVANAARKAVLDGALKPRPTAAFVRLMFGERAPGSWGEFKTRLTWFRVLTSTLDEPEHAWKVAYYRARGMKAMLWKLEKKGEHHEAEL